MVLADLWRLRHTHMDTERKGVSGMFPAYQQQKRLLLLLKSGRWPNYVAIILVACASCQLHALWLD